jgi:hypothetical protein
MIGKRTIDRAKQYCRDDISKIPGYDIAVSSKDRYEIHHMNELTFTSEELKKMNMYFHRPASELRLMTSKEHHRWHIKWNGHPMKGRNSKESPMYGKGYLVSGDKNGKWKGDDVCPHQKLMRAKREFNKGNITEDELRLARDEWNKFQNEYRKKRKLECQQ